MKDIYIEPVEDMTGKKGEIYDEIMPDLNPHVLLLSHNLCSPFLNIYFTVDKHIYLHIYIVPR